MVVQVIVNRIKTHLLRCSKFLRFKRHNILTVARKIKKKHLEDSEHTHVSESVDWSETVAWLGAGRGGAASRQGYCTTVLKLWNFPVKWLWQILCMKNCSNYGNANNSFSEHPDYPPKYGSIAPLVWFIPGLTLPWFIFFLLFLFSSFDFA